MDGRRFLSHHGLKVDKARRFPAESFGDSLVGFRFPESDTTPDGGGQTAERSSARSGKQKATATA